MNPHTPSPETLNPKPIPKPYPPHNQTFIPETLKPETLKPQNPETPKPRNKKPLNTLQPLKPLPFNPPPLSTLEPHLVCQYEVVEHAQAGGRAAQLPWGEQPHQQHGVEGVAIHARTAPVTVEQLAGTHWREG